MKIVGNEGNDGIVHTIDVWFSKKRRAWIVERLDGEGNQIGAAHLCRDDADAAACVGEWLRAHGEIHLVATYQAAIEQVASPGVQRQSFQHQDRYNQDGRRQCRRPAA